MRIGEIQEEPMEPYKYIGMRIREARKDARYSLGEFSKILGVGKSTLSEMERGIIKVNMDKLPEIARLLEKPVQYFLPPSWAPDNGLPDHISYLVNAVMGVSIKDLQVQLAYDLARFAERCRYFEMYAER
jgi:transcriptional regulator with XRE-family HTH domain